IEEYFDMFRCASADPTNCTASDWELIEETTQDRDANTVAADSLPGFSTYLVAYNADAAESDQQEDQSGSEDDTDDNTGGSGDDGTDTGGGGGGGGQSQPASDQEQLQEALQNEDQEQLAELLQVDQEVIEELLQNEDAVAELLTDQELREAVLANTERLEELLETEVPIALETTMSDPTYRVGTNTTELLRTENIVNRTVDVSFDIEGDISQILELDHDEATIQSDTVDINTIDVNVPFNTEPGGYTGRITAEAENYTESVTLAVVVAERTVEGFTFELNVVTNPAEADDPIRTEEFFSDIAFETPFGVNVTYMLRRGVDNQLVASVTEQRQVEEDPASFTNVIATNESLDAGFYYIQAVAEHRGAVTTRIETFQVIDPFWTQERTRFILFFLIALGAIVSTWRIYKWYLTRREEEARYVFPVDYNKLPSEPGYNVGQIAETSKDAIINPDDLTTHAIVAGSTGAGKSVTASAVVEEALEQDVPVVVFDPTAQWTGFVQKCQDENLLNEYERFGMDPEEDPKPFKGLIKRIDADDPDIDFEELMNPGEITVFTLDHLTTEEFDQVVRQIIDSIFEVEWEESPDLEMLVVFDEVHRLLEKYGGEGGYHALERGAREFRKWGIGLMMASQVTADFKQAVSGNIMTEIQMQTKSMEDIERIKRKYGDQFAQRITSVEVGTGMIQNPEYNEGQPWFVDFRPTYHNPHKLPESDLEKYYEYTDRLDAIEDKLDALEEQGEDVYDQRLELDLAKNKLKEGRFKMAEIYIESLEEEFE
ncbi:MAG: DUF87 domain-containing protein, partial [Candidatus Nanohaloarchaeota archaeon QJJ-5]|nr:DUF87 domain-containing protein [Candidatus Nanohaloarchaeota archaeon QJJ-5]